LSRTDAANVSVNNLAVEHTAGALGCGAPAANANVRNGPGACDTDLAGMAPGAIVIGSAAGVSVTNYSSRSVGGYGIKVR